MAVKKRKSDEKPALGDGKNWFRGRFASREPSGTVYLAHRKEPKLGKANSPAIMAIKSAPVSDSCQLQEERDLLKKFEKGQPYIRECFGEEITFGRNGKPVYNLLLEHGSGGTISSLIARTLDSGVRLSESEVSSYANSILNGINHIHEMGYEIVDLKPECIVLVLVDDSFGGYKYMAKIGDFRVAEKVESRQVRNRSDIWYLGCLVLGMLIGTNPWHCESEPQIDDFIWRTEGYSSTEDEEFLSWVSEEAKDFLECCLGRGTTQKLTAEMLLTHPFLAASRVNQRSKAPSICSDDCESSSSSCSWTEDLHVMPLCKTKESREKASQESISSAPSCSEAVCEISASTSHQGSLPVDGDEVDGTYFSLKEVYDPGTKDYDVADDQIHSFSTCNQQLVENLKRKQPEVITDGTWELL